MHALLSACFIFCVLYYMRALFFCAVLSPCALLSVCLIKCVCVISAPLLLYGFIYGFAPLPVFAPVPIFAFFVRICSCALIGYPHMPPICKNLMVFHLCCPCVINLSSTFLHHAISLNFIVFEYPRFSRYLLFTSPFYIYFLFFIFCDFFLFVMGVKSAILYVVNRRFSHILLRIYTRKISLNIFHFDSLEMKGKDAISKFPP